MAPFSAGISTQILGSILAPVQGQITVKRARGHHNILGVASAYKNFRLRANPRTTHFPPIIA